MHNCLTHIEVRFRTLAEAAPERDSGAGIVEYLLLVLFIGLALILAITFFSGQLSEGFSNAGNSIPS
jgi:Flp pilus assembly pilin Flp